jgi:hypothetical protein
MKTIAKVAIHGQGPKPAVVIPSRAGFASLLADLAAHPPVECAGHVSDHRVVALAFAIGLAAFEHLAVFANHRPVVQHVHTFPSAFAFSSRGGHARNAEDGAVLTWPDGLHSMVTKLSASITSRVGKEHTWSLPGFAARVDEKTSGIEVLCVRIDKQNVPSTFVLKARRVVCAMPLFVALHVIPNLAASGFEASRDLPPRAPWLVSNFLMDGMPREAQGVPLAWDNVVYRGEGLGYVVSTHQLIRLSPPQRSVFSAYQALDLKTPDDTRRWLAAAHPDDLRTQAAIDLVPAYGRDLWRHAAALEITVRGHAMATPDVGFLSRPGLLALRDLDGPILFAHADLSGMSLFEEASYWGVLAANRVLR